MDSEIQRRRTFEIIAKWIAKQNGVRVEFLDNCIPHADPKNKVIRLPKNVKEDNLDKVLALVFHEAAHIKKSGFDLKKLVGCREDMHVLNAVEDQRVDNANMAYLPKVRDFYEELVKWEDEFTKKNNPTNKPIPFEHQVLCDMIRIMTGFGNNASKDPKVRAHMSKTKLLDDADYLSQLLDSLEYGNQQAYPDTKKLVDKMVKKLYGKKKRTPTEEPNQTGQGQGQGKDGQGGGQGQGQGQGKGKQGKGQGEGEGAGNAAGNTPGIQQGQSPGGFGCGKHSALFEPDPKAKYALDEASFDEQTIRAFNELLTIKSIRTIQDGHTLDCDNLTAFFTGAIDELFKSRKIVKQKKSKILMLFDSSGSMHDTDGLCDSKRKSHILVAVGKKLQTILDDIRDHEGVNVDYDIRAFDTRYIVLKKEGWEHEYLRRNGGGTDCAMAFMAAQDEILADSTIDGNKIVILITDGQIDHYQVDAIHDRIIKHNADVKAMILGVGLDKHFEAKIGGRNIIATELADGAVLQAIEDMLE